MLLSCKRLTSRHYRGCFPSDMLPEIYSYPACIIANTDPSTRRGKHWVCLFIASSRLAYFFCPFGRRPNGHILRYLRRFETIVRNKCEFQPKNSITCGLYAIFVAYWLCANFTYEDILNELCESKNPDNTVMEFLSSLIASCKRKDLKRKVRNAAVSMVHHNAGQSLVP